jgi:hypothetical protein
MTTTRPALFAAALALLPAWALAETSPWYVGVSQAFTHDSNVYRIGQSTVLPAHLQRSDSYASTSLLAGLDQPIGRQRLFGNVALRTNRFKDNESLDNESYNALLGADWATVNRLSGTLSAAATQNLARFNPDRDVPTVLSKNTERTQQLDAKVRLGVVTRWTGEASFSWRKVDYSADEYRSREFEQKAVSAGARYAPSNLLSLGAFLRRTEGRYDRYRSLTSGGFAADRYDRNDLDFTGSWSPSAASTLSGRISLSQTEHSEALRRDFSGATGLVRWQWKPTGKLRVNTSLSRDTGEENTFLDFGSTQTLASESFSRTTTALRLQTDYELTSKIQLGAGAGYSRRSLADTFSFGNGTPIPRDGRDATSSYSLNARWLPTRSLQLSCDVSRDRRTASGGLSDAYSVTIVGCAGQFLLQ